MSLESSLMGQCNCCVASGRIKTQSGELACNLPKYCSNIIIAIDKWELTLPNPRNWIKSMNSHILYICSTLTRTHK